MVPLRATKAGARLEKQGARSPLPSDKLVSEVRIRVWREKVVYPMAEDRSNRYHH